MHYQRQWKYELDTSCVFNFLAINKENQNGYERK